jgi:OmcA/MtrC family decaheme c-type cytochrome
MGGESLSSRCALWGHSAICNAVELTEVTVKGRKPLSVLFGLILLGVAISIAGDGIQPEYTPAEKAYYLTAAQASFVRPGLKVDIQKVEIDSSRSVNVTFKLSDDQAQPLDRLGIQTPGPIALQFILARIKPEDTQYSNYFSRSFTSAVTGAPLLLPATDTTGVYADLGNGVYRYTFGNKVPADYETDATHTLGIQAARDLTAFDMGKFVANATLNFVPSGLQVTQVRDIVRIENCNQCHDPLALHGGNRRDTKLCILCHQPQNIDPPTGNSLDFKVYIHKIHMGSSLPSVSGIHLSRPATANGAIPAALPGGSVAPKTPYKLGSVDYSTVVWPQDVRNCTTCHQKGTQSDNWKTNPSRAACGSCHDDINFETGDNHPGGVQLDDTRCTICHKSDTGVEFDLSIPGAHTIPTNSTTLPGLNIRIVQVSNTNPGDHPVVTFTASDRAGNPVDVSKLDRLNLILAGPTSDYAFVTPAEDARRAPAGATGFSYTFQATIPADAQGTTYAIGGEAFRNVNVLGSLIGPSYTVRDTAFNPVFYFGVGGSSAVPRRTVVDRNNCNQCHKSLALHGGARQNPQYCVMCHNTHASDVAGRTIAKQLPEQTINFRTHIHRIHRGEDLATDWTIFGGSGSPSNFNGARFPGDLRNCSKCHAGNSYQLPLPDGLADTPTPRLFFTPTKPVASACLGCHDEEDASAHAFQMTAPFAESCPVCHEEGADFAVTKVHARNP